MMKPDEAVRRTYEAYNKRDMAAALAGLHPDVLWDGGEEGMLHGKGAVERHWDEQWRTLDTKIDIVSTQWVGSGLIVQAVLEFRGADGTMDRRDIRNTITFEDKLINSMRIG
jgi:hypothetical protein